jgi:HlyD family secretion protein
VVLQEIWGPNGQAKVKVGDTPWRGMPLVEIPDLTTMMVKAKVNEVHISAVRPGQQVIITIDALTGDTFYGKVSRVATLATRERGSEVKTFDVEILLDGTDPQLRPGMTAQCRIITDRLPDKLYVPLESVIQKDDTTVVYVKKSGFHRRPVQIGAKNSDYVVIEKGLTSGELVAMRDPTLPVKELGGESGAIKEKRPGPSKGSSGRSVMIRVM